MFMNVSSKPKVSWLRWTVSGDSRAKAPLARRYLVRIEDEYVLVLLALAAVISALLSGPNKRFKRITTHNPHPRF